MSRDTKMSIFNTMARVESMLADNTAIFDEGDLSVIVTSIDRSLDHIARRRARLKEQIAEAMIPLIDTESAEHLFYLLYPDGQYNSRVEEGKHAQIHALGKAPHEVLSTCTVACKYCYSELYDENTDAHMETCIWLRTHRMMMNNFPSWYAPDLR